MLKDELVKLTKDAVNMDKSMDVHYTFLKEHVIKMLKLYASCDTTHRTVFQLPLNGIYIDGCKVSWVDFLVDDVNKIKAHFREHVSIAPTYKQLNNLGEKLKTYFQSQNLCVTYECNSTHLTIDWTTVINTRGITCIAI